MTTQPLTRADHQRAIAEIDAGTVATVLAIFERDEIKQAVQDLEALIDRTDAGAAHRSPSADANALVHHALLPLRNVPLIAASLAAALAERLSPPAPAGPEPTAASLPAA